MHLKIQLCDRIVNQTSNKMSVFVMEARLSTSWLGIWLSKEVRNLQSDHWLHPDSPTEPTYLPQREASTDHVDFLHKSHAAPIVSFSFKWLANLPTWYQLRKAKYQNEQSPIEIIPIWPWPVERYSACHRLSDNTTYEFDQDPDNGYTTYYCYPN